MKTASVREVQHHFARVLRMVEAGESVVITRRNRTVARLVPEPPPMDPQDRLADRVEELHALYEGRPPTGPALSDQVLADREDRA